MSIFTKTLFSSLFLAALFVGCANSPYEHCDQQRSCAEDANIASAEEDYEECVYLVDVYAAIMDVPHEDDCSELEDAQDALYDCYVDNMQCTEEGGAISDAEACSEDADTFYAVYTNIFLEEGDCQALDPSEFFEFEGGYNYYDDEYYDDEDYDDEYYDDEYYDEDY